MAMRTLVTGGLGFVGRHLVQQLTEQGDDVRVLDLSEPDDACPGDVEYLTGSILDPGHMRRALAGVDRLFHLAANPDLWNADRSGFHRVNYLGTKTVLAEAARHDLHRIVYTSTESILRPRHAMDGLIDETVAPRLGNMPGAYCRSKFMAEQEAFNAVRHGAPVVIVNPTMPVGPGDHRLTPPSRMLLGYLNGSFPMYLECVMNLVDVRSVATGHILAAQHGTVGSRYILGGENLRLGALLRRLEVLTGLTMPRRRIPYWVAYGAATISEAVANYVTRRPPAAPLSGVRLVRRPLAFDSSKAMAELDYRPAPLDAALADTIAWFARHGLLKRPVTRLNEPAARVLEN